METNKLIETLGLEKLSIEEQEAVLLSFGELVFKGTIVRILERMSEPDKEAFSKMLDGNPSEDEVMAYIKANVPDADKAVEEAIAEVTSDILAVNLPVNPEPV